MTRKWTVNCFSSKITSEIGVKILIRQLPARPEKISKVYLNTNCKFKIHISVTMSRISRHLKVKPIAYSHSLLSSTINFFHVLETAIHTQNIYKYLLKQNTTEKLVIAVVEIEWNIYVKEKVITTSTNKVFFFFFISFCLIRNHWIY